MKLSYLKIAVFVVISSIGMNVQAVAVEQTAPAVGASSFPSIAASITNSLTTQWVAKVFGAGIGAAGLMPIDINNDGIKEIVFTSTISSNPDFKSANSYSVLSYQKASKNWGISRQTVLPQDIAITASTTYRYNTPFGNNNAILAYASHDNSLGQTTLQILDLTANKPVKSIVLNSGGYAVNELLIGDGDNDGRNELIAVTENTTYLYNLTDFKASGNLAYGAAHATLGNVDNDADNELVYVNGKVIRYKNSNVTLKWNYPLGFGDIVRLANIDTDTPKEILALKKHFYLRALDADIHSVKWENPFFGYSGPEILEIADINKDGKNDIILSDVSWVYALNNKGNPFWGLYNPGDGFINISVFDADNDGDQDIVWGVENGYFYIYDTFSKIELFRNNKTSTPPFIAVTFGDVDNDGQQEFITVNSTYGNRDEDTVGIIRVINADTGVLKWQSSSKDNYYNGLFIKGFAATVGDIDYDGKNELIIAGNTTFESSAICAIDVNNHTNKGCISGNLGFAYPLYAVKIADVNGDGYKDIVAAGGGTLGGKVYVNVIDGLTKAEWRSHNLSTGGNKAYGLDITDLNGDGHLDILLSGDYLFAFDGVTHVNWMSSANGYSGISIKAIPNSTAHNIVAGNSAGELRILNSNLNTTLATYPVCTTAIGAVEMLKYDKILFTCGEQLKIFDLTTKLTVWNSGKIATGLDSDSLAVKWVNGALKVGLGANLSRLMRYNP